MSDGRKLRAVVAGSGFGCRIQIPALRGAGFEVVGLVGTDARRTADRAAVNQVPQSFIDIDEAITRTGATVVAIGTSPASHAPLSFAAIRRGCHVLCEKPLALDYAEAASLLQAARKARVVHAVGNEFRYIPARAMMARLIAEGAIGEPKFVTAVQYSNYVSTFEADLPGWWFDRHAGGGWLLAAGSHGVDQIRNCLGEFESVSGTLPTVFVSRGPVEDSFSVRFRLANGAEGVMQQTASAAGSFAEMLRVAGTKGSVWIEGVSSSADFSTLWLADRGETRQVRIPPDLELGPPPPVTDDPRQHSAEWQSMAPVELGPYAALCRAFRAAIEGVPPPSTVAMPTFEDGVSTMGVLDAILASAQAGGTLMQLAGPTV
jgi:predicted dehydrogenase